MKQSPWLPDIVAVILATVTISVSVAGWELIVIPSDRVIEKSVRTPVVLTCQALGLTEGDDPKLQWKENNDNVITATSGRLYVDKSISKHKLTLHIDSMLQTLAGRYTCTGTARGQTYTVSRELSVVGVPQVLNASPQNVNATTGLSLALSCQVLNQGSHTVRWFFEKNSQKLSTNYTVLVDDGRYSVIRPIGDFLGTAYNLQIENIKTEDAGVYKCMMDGTRQQKIVTVTVVDAVQVNKSAVIPRADFTDCCVEKGVSAKCQPVCNYRAVDFSKFNLENCALDVINLLQCGADKRNHVPCCRERYVPEMCLDLCLPDASFTISFSHLRCLNYSIDIFQCYEEGQFLLPSPPAKVHVSSEGAGILVVKWEAPKENAAKVTGYKVFYKNKDTAVFRSTQTQPAMSRLYKLTGMKSGVYHVYVMALSTHGASMPSAIVEITAGDGGDPDNMPGSNNETLAGCCRRRGVSIDCQGLCQGNPGLDRAKLMTCVNDMDKVLTCVAGERDHTACCRRRKISNDCLSMCRGQPPEDRLSLVSCFGQMFQITSCFQEGMGYLPSSPIDVTIQDVRDRSAKVSWKAGSLATSYIVRYTEMATGRDATEVMVSSPRLSYTMLNLLPQHMYKVAVASYNKNGTSIPSPSIIFLTHASEIKTPATVAPQTPYNVTECCIKKGVRPKCMDLCTYDIETLAGAGSQHFRDCELDLVTLLSCGTDNRNHIPCCKRSGISELCLPLCRISANFTFLESHMSCLSYTADMVNCMKEGVESRPGPPVNVTVTHKTTNNIQLSWLPPEKAPKGVDYYVVEYRKYAPNSMLQTKKSNNTVYILQNLEVDTLYQMRVKSINEHGESLPSVVISDRTLQKSQPTQMPPTDNHPANISECCRSKGVRAACQPLCEGRIGLNMFTCVTEFEKLLHCAADGRDHRPCCRRRYVSATCLPICMGNVSSPAAECMAQAPSILTCFWDGQATLPSPPTYFRMEQVHNRYAILSWRPPAKNSEGVSYTVYVQDINAKKVVKEEIVSALRYNVSDLQPNTQYRVYVIASNEHGASLPSSVITFFTKAEIAPVISITQSPEGILEIGEHVLLVCEAKGSPKPTVYWKYKDQTREGSTLPLDHVSPDDGVLYTCIASNGVGPDVSETFFVKIRRKPDVLPVNPKVTQKVNAGLQSVLSCLFWGYPTEIKWYLGDQEVPPKDKASVYKTSVFEKLRGQVIQADLYIQLVRTHHLGVYRCVGRNKNGTASTSIVLQSESSGSVVEPFPKPHNLSACCINQGVHPACQGLCHFGITLQSLQALSKENMVRCEAEAPRILQCAANGRDNTKCCRQKQVAPLCLSLCLGRVNPDLSFNDKMKCLPHLDNIVNCLEQGSVMLPGPPESLTAAIQQGRIVVQWQPPKTNYDAVKAYEVFYNTSRVTDHGTQTANFSFRHYSKKAIITDLTENTQYVIYAKAFNNLGQSHRSNIATLKTSELFPFAPHDVTSSLVNGVEIKMMWKEPPANRGSVTMFHVYYRAFSEHGQSGYQKVDVKGYSVILTGLKSHTKYEVFVTANNTEHESEPSKKVYIYTAEEIAVQPPASRSGKGPNSVAVGLGVFFVLLIICIAVIVAVVYFLRSRRKTLRFKESVSFENPGYVRSTDAGESVQITGLPNEPMNPSAKTHTSNGHGPVRNGKQSMYGVSSDTHSDNSYTELSPPLTGHTPDLEYATLDISHMETLEGIQLQYDHSLSKI